MVIGALLGLFIAVAASMPAWDLSAPELYVVGAVAVAAMICGCALTGLVLRFRYKLMELSWELYHEGPKTMSEASPTFGDKVV